MATIIIFMDSDNRLNRLVNSTKEHREPSPEEGGEDIIIPPLTTDELMAKDYPDITDYCEIDTSELPTLFKGAWVKEGQSVVVDMPQAREIHMDDIRIVRNQELEKKDKEIYIAEDTGDQAHIDSLRAERQVLRDIPQTFDLSGATTPEELYALWPSELPPRE